MWPVFPGLVSSAILEIPLQLSSFCLDLLLLWCDLYTSVVLQRISRKQLEFGISKNVWSAESFFLRRMKSLFLNTELEDPVHTKKQDPGELDVW